MRLFTINEKGEMVQYQELDYPEVKSELDLEILLENNPEYFFENSDVFIIGRQVSTNLNSIIDLLGLDRFGNTVVVELKRGRTPRDTVAQLLEYASFIENLDYSQLNEIHHDYNGEETTLEERHQQYFEHDFEEKVSFNKEMRLVIVAQNISKEIKQTCLFLRKKGIDIYCMEFKYFETEAGEKIISSDFVVGEDDYLKIKGREKTIDEAHFMQSLDSNGLRVFQPLFSFAKEEGLLIRWGSKGFSMNVPLGTENIGFLQGYLGSSRYNQSILCLFNQIERKLVDSDEIISTYKEKLEGLGFFKASSDLLLKWDIDRPHTEDEVNEFLLSIKGLVESIRESRRD